MPSKLKLNNVRATRVYGYSDDLVELENADNHMEGVEIDYYERDVRVNFNDGTVIRVSYGISGEWRIKVTKHGTAKHELTMCKDLKINNPHAYSDIFTIQAKPIKTSVVRPGK